MLGCEPAAVELPVLVLIMLVGMANLFLKDLRLYGGHPLLIVVMLWDYLMSLTIATSIISGRWLWLFGLFVGVFRSIIIAWSVCHLIKQIIFQ